jgi:hypothetical protein
MSKGMTKIASEVQIGGWAVGITEWSLTILGDYDVAPGGSVTLGLKG